MSRAARSPGTSGRAEAEQRPREPPLARAHAGEAARRRVLGQAVQNRLRLIVAVVGGGDDVAAARGGELSRALVAERAGAGLETGAAESTPQADDMERHPGRRAAARDDLAVPIGVGAAGAVVDMQGREAQLQACLLY